MKCGDGFCVWSQFVDRSKCPKKDSDEPCRDRVSEERYWRTGQAMAGIDWATNEINNAPK